MTNNLSEESREFYNARISELYKIIDHYEGIVRDYISLVNSMQKEITDLQDEVIKYMKDFNSIKGSCEALGKKCENQRKELVYLNRRNTNLRHKLNITNQYIKSEYFRNKKYAITPEGYEVASRYATLNEIRKKELNSRG